MINSNVKRINIICGHYGSGKSEFSLNFAQQINTDKIIGIVDLDVINPYFRSREVRDIVDKEKIEIISDTLNSTIGLDMPYVSAKMKIPLQNENYVGIYDIGGNDVGMKVLHQVGEEMKNLNPEVLCVFNVFRPETNSVESILEMIDKIEGESNLKITGLVNNSNFIRGTEVRDIIYGEKILLEVSKKKKIPLKYTSVWEKLVPELPDNIKGEVVPLKLLLRKEWL